MTQDSCFVVKLGFVYKNVGKLLILKKKCPICRQNSSFFKAFIGMHFAYKKLSNLHRLEIDFVEVKSESM